MLGSVHHAHTEFEELRGLTVVKARVSVKSLSIKANTMATASDQWLSENVPQRLQVGGLR